MLTLCSRYVCALTCVCLCECVHVLLETWEMPKGIVVRDVNIALSNTICPLFPVLWLVYEFPQKWLPCLAIPLPVLPLRLDSHVF